MDNNKGIIEIVYNHLNLPKKITFDKIFENNTEVKGTIEYLYDANGTKLKKKVTEGTTVTNTHYIDGFQYRAERKETVRWTVLANEPAGGLAKLDFFPHAEGYVKVTHASSGGVGGGSTNYNYVFNYTDHPRLREEGNIRLRYAINPVNQWLEILEEDHYYPFGLKHNGYNAQNYVFMSLDGGPVELIPTNPNVLETYKYKFSNKELQEEFGINVYDFGFRNYQPDLGRWMNMDPLAENYINISPYTYVANSPLLFTDPDGQRIIVGKDDYEYKEDRDYNAIEDDFYREVYRALDGLYQHATITIGEGDEAKEVNIIQELIDMEFKSVEIKRGVHEFQPNDNDEYKSYILFDPNIGVEFLTGDNYSQRGTNSPAGSLAHELGHAYNYNFDLKAFNKRFYDTSTQGKIFSKTFLNLSYKNAEEEYTTNMVNPILKLLGEDQRNNYGGWFFINKSNGGNTNVFSRTIHKYLTK